MLNDEQLRVFENIQEHLSNGTQLLLFVSGEGGTGKSVLLQHCVKYVREFVKDENAVDVVAPTGTAAYNVFGKTIHSSFNIPVKGTMTRKAIEKLKESHANLKWLFVDEVSMVSKPLFQTLSNVCKKIKDSSAEFGGINVVVFGDLLQLSPVKAEWIFKAPCWNLFLFVELKRNLRQQGDDAFHNFCQRLREGAHSDSDVKLLETRMLTRLSEEVRETFKNAIHVFTRRSAATELNKLKSSEIKCKQTFRAIDRVTKETSDGRELEIELSASERARYQRADVFDVPFCIDLGTGSRVMMRSNINTSLGLVNGRTGTVTGVSQDMVHVLFDDAVEDAQITKAMIKKHDNLGYLHCRYQIPLIHCWGVTAHKVQGMTIPKMVVSFAPSDLFCPGIAYVVMSRVQSLKDLAIGMFCPIAFLKNMPDVRAVSELKRLRKLCLTA